MRVHVCLCDDQGFFAYLRHCRYQSAGASWGDRRRHYVGDVHDHQPAGQQVRVQSASEASLF